jgi:hypothetical protein
MESINVISMFFTFLLSLTAYFIVYIVSGANKLVSKYNLLIDDYNLLARKYNELLSENKQNIEDYNTVVKDYNVLEVTKYNSLVNKYNSLLISTKLINEEPKEEHVNAILEKISNSGEENLTKEERLYLEKFSLWK